MHAAPTGRAAHARLELGQTASVERIYEFVRCQAFVARRDPRLRPRVYKTEEPARRHLRRCRRSWERRAGSTAWFDIRRHRGASRRRKLYANVDSTRASTYTRLGSRWTLILPIFAVSPCRGGRPTSRVKGSSANIDLFVRALTIACRSMAASGSCRSKQRGRFLCGQIVVREVPRGGEPGQRCRPLHGVLRCTLPRARSSPGRRRRSCQRSRGTGAYRAPWRALRFRLFAHRSSSAHSGCLRVERRCCPTDSAGARLRPVAGTAALCSFKPCCCLAQAVSNG